MNSKSLTPEQIAQLQRTVGRMRLNLDCLSGRCHQKYFPADDPLKVAADRASEAVNQLDEVLKVMGGR